MSRDVINLILITFFVVFIFYTINNINPAESYVIYGDVKLEYKELKKRSDRAILLVVDNTEVTRYTLGSNRYLSTHFFRLVVPSNMVNSYSGAEGYIYIENAITSRRKVRIGAKGEFEYYVLQYVLEQ